MCVFFSIFKIETYLTHLATRYSNIAVLESIGYSYEGRPIWILKISTGRKSNKPVVLIDAGIHAREWLAHATALYAIHQLVVNKTNSGMLEHVDWHIIPSLNPDGYEFSHTVVFT